tara:strand:- start:17667 stop:18356 length:690 start_codon:yes stop_codon:yes gene_type:complete
MNKAIVIFSGGQDSTTCLIQAQQHFDEIHCVTFDYGQRHKQEIEVARNICKKLEVYQHKIMDVTLLNELSISALTRDDIPVPSQHYDQDIPSSFVPGRNILFLTLAGIYAYQIGAKTLITGVCETDFSNYPDCRHDFVQAQQKVLSLGMDYELDIQTPLMWLTKAETWALADQYKQLEFIKNETLTCYNGIIGTGCQSCIACDLRQKGLEAYLASKENELHHSTTHNFL